jgi:hypothetical protein
MTNSSRFFLEDLADLHNFDTNPLIYSAILDPAIPFDSYRSPNDPYLTFESEFDYLDSDKQGRLITNTSKRLDRRVRRSPLAQDRGVGDTKLRHVWE